MEKEVKNAVKELLEKIPEDHLEKAAGGLTDRTKKILMGAGLFATGVGVGGGAAFLLSRKGKTPPDPVTPKPVSEENKDNPGGGKNASKSTDTSFYADYTEKDWSKDYSS